MEHLQYGTLLSSSVRIGTLYFDGGKLKEWVGQGQQTMALFEKIKTVGKGESAHGCHGSRLNTCSSVASTSWHCRNTHVNPTHFDHPLRPYTP